MLKIRTTSRRVGVCAAGAISVVGGLVLTWRVIPQDVIGEVATSELVVLMGLLVFPIATLAALEFDRRVLRKASASSLKAPAKPVGRIHEVSAPIERTEPSRRNRHRRIRHAGRPRGVARDI